MKVVILLICILSIWTEAMQCRPQLEEPTTFSIYLETISKSATELVKLQQKIAKHEKLSAAEKKQYNSYIEVLSETAQNLTKFEEARADLEPTEFNDHIKGIKSKIEAFGGFKSDTKIGTNSSANPLAETNKPKPINQPVVIDHKETEAKDKDTDTVTVNTPPTDASIAEAKPVALSIAGVGGVASAKPVATAVVGPGGLAVSRPVATAIAGVDPDDIGGLNIAGFKHQKN